MIVFSADDLRSLTAAYSEHTGITLHALSLAATGNAKTLKRLLDGKSCNLPAAEQASGYFVSNWPDDLDWVASISRERVLDDVVPRD